MSESVARYGFLPFLRIGLGARIQNETLGNGVIRASADLTVEASGTGPGQSHTVSRNVEFRGPGDIVGIDPRVIIRTDPKPDATDFESNFFPLVELPPDFPWRYTPIGPAETGGPDSSRARLKPWLCLVVLKESEFSGLSMGDPLPRITVKAPNGTLREVLPDLEESWAWAHVQVVDTLSGDEALDFNQVDAVAEYVTATPHLAVSRIPCMRRLEPKTRYFAFLVPTFETGRLAGLGSSPADARGDAPAWELDDSEVELPFYHQFEFVTGELGDFESLVGRLGPEILGNQIGIREIDVSEPGPPGLIPGISPPKGEDEPTLRLEGALQSFAVASSVWPSLPEGKSDPFRSTLLALLNATETGDEDDDPFLLPPIYGRWHASETQIGPASHRWLRDLNLDPRHRTAAGFGTEVIQAGQERYMAEAWRQIGDLDLANDRIRAGQVGIAISERIMFRHIEPSPVEAFITRTHPLHLKVLGSATTIRHQLNQSPIPSAFVSSTYRKLVRPRGRLARRAFLRDGRGVRRPNNLLSRINQGEVSVPEKQRLDGVIPLEGRGQPKFPEWVPASWQRALRYPLLFVIIALALLIGVGLLIGLSSAAISVVAGGIVALGVILERRMGRARRVERAIERFNAEGLASMELPDDFRLGDVQLSWDGAPSREPAVGIPPELLRAQTRAFQTVAVEVLRAAQPEVEIPPSPQPIDLARIRDRLSAALDPYVTIPASVLANLQLGAAFIPTPEQFDTIMDHPVFTDAMYEPLRGLSQDNLLPGIDQVPPNTVGLLRTNQQFVEAYLLGVNHEMGRELLWREYPTDQRGSYFRQFWDISTHQPLPPPRSEDREAYWDIRPIHQWGRGSELGENRPPSGPDVGGANLVLLVRGDLLRKYPNTLIYAVEATTITVGGNTYPKRKEGAEPRMPIFMGALPPDITFVGFDLMENDVREGAGWFFVFEEPFAEARFGMDLPPSQPPNAATGFWNELSWGHIHQDANYVPIQGGGPLVSGVSTTKGDGLGQPSLLWGRDSAAMAAITLQPPVRILMHSSLMLPNEEED